MQVVPRRTAAPAPAPYAAADAVYADAKAYLSSREAQQMSESDLEARRAAAGEPVGDESVVVLTFDGKGVALHHEDLREATRRAAARRRQQREPLCVFNRLQPGEKKHAKRMATAAVYAVAPFVRCPEEFLQSLMPRQPAAKTKAKARHRAKTAAVRPHPVAKRVWTSLEHDPAEVVAEAMLEAERHDPERVKRWVVLVDGAETQLDLVEAGATAYGVDVTVILDIIHVVEYVWKAAHVFHDEGSPSWRAGVDARAGHSRGQGPPGSGGDAAFSDRRRPHRATPASRSTRARTTC